MREHFEAMLDADPEDWTCRAIYADFLEEQGEVVAAQCQRWMVERKRRPHTSSMTTMGWTWYYEKREGHDAPSDLTKNIAAALTLWQERIGEHFCYRTRQAAESALADALLRCGLITVTGTPAPP